MQVAIINRATELCNLGCRYCFVKASSAAGRRLSVEHSIVLIEGLIGAGFTKFDLYWEGGEPLAAGIEFFRQMAAAQKKLKSQYPVTITNRLQTNATLITPQWIDFFQQEHFSLGVSLDGIRTVHDRNRPFLNGRNSFDRVISSINRMRSAGLHIGILSVLTRENVGGIPEYYSFIKSIGAQTFKINPCFSNKESNRDMQVRPEEWGEAMMQLFDLWFNDSAPPSNAYLFGIIKSLYLGYSSACMFDQTCFTSFLCLVPSGDVFPCARLVNEDPDFHLGNVYDGAQQIISNWSALKPPLRTGCSDCEWNSICYGGCTAYAYSAHRTANSKDYLCEGYKLLFQHIHRTLRHMDGDRNLDRLSNVRKLDINLLSEHLTHPILGKAYKEIRKNRRVQQSEALCQAEADRSGNGTRSDWSGDWTQSDWSGDWTQSDWSGDWTQAD
jgi:uncharacterized protein